MHNYKSKKTSLTDDSGLSRNHGESVKYKIRIQEEKEAQELLNEELLRMNIEKPPQGYFNEDE